MLLATLALASLSASKLEQPLPAKLVAGHGLFVARAEAAVEDATIRVSIPVPYRGQTPVAIDVAHEPPDAVRSLRVVREGENRYLEIALAPLAAGAAVRVDVTSYVLLRPTTPADGDGARLVDPAAMPADVRAQLGPAPGVDSDAAEVIAIARTLDHADLAATVAGVLGYLKREIGVGSGPQGALEVLARKGSVCTGAANLSAALLIAAGIPARILPCVMIGLEQQEHYIVEAWSSSTGWIKLEPTLKKFPLDDTLHLVVRFVDRETPRSYGSVPLYRPVGSAGVAADFDDRHPRRCWQSAEVLATFELPPGELEAIERPARAAFEALEREPSPGPEVRFAPKKAPSALRSRGRKLLEELDRALAPDRR